MLKFPEFFNFLAKIPKFWKNSDRTLIWIVRLVRSLANRTFQLRSGRLAERRVGWAQPERILWQDTIQGPLLAVVRQPKIVFRQRCFSDGARDSEFRQPRKFFRLSHSGEKWQCFPFKKFIQCRIWTCVFVRAVFSSAQASLTYVQIAATSRRILQWFTMYVCRH